MRGGSFRTRIVALITALVLGAQAVTLLAVLAATDANVRTEATRQLERGARLFDRLLQTRNAQLLETVTVLVQDFGFREAVASGDAATIASALTNHARRIDAANAMLLDPAGSLVASSEGTDAESLPSLVARARHEGHLVAIAVFHQHPYQLVVVPVRAPLVVGWVAMGFPIDQPLASELERLTGLDVTFIAAEGASTNHRVVASTRRATDRAEPADLATGEYLSHAVVLPTMLGHTQALLQRSLADALAPYRTLRLEMLALASIAALLAVVAGVAIARGIARPVQGLAAAARRIAHGDYHETVDLGASDEFRFLARTFDHMQRGIAEREARIRHQATHDELTGLPNRTLARDRVEGALRRARRHRSRVSLLSLSLPRLRLVDESLGHDVGARTVRAVATAIVARVRASDSVARIGDAHFLVVAERADAAAGGRLARALAAGISRGTEVEGIEILPGVAIGIAVCPEHGDDVEILMRRADIALADAEEGTQEIAFYRDGRDEDQRRRLALVGDLRRAVIDNQLRLHFQPKVGLRGARTLGFEALVRWIHPRHGFMSPDEFIPVAERSGAITVLTGWVLREALRQCRRWRDAGMRVSVAVNLSAVDLRDEALPDRIESLLSSEGVAPDGLVLEVTESAAMHDPVAVQRTLGRLRAAGVRIAIDDFGTGFSSLAKLKEMPLDELKIDKSFVLHLVPGGEDALIVRSTIELAHGMGLAVTAEGVENEACVALLEEFGCDMAQGYHYSRPLTAQDATEWLRRQTAEPPIGAPPPHALAQARA